VNGWLGTAELVWYIISGVVAAVFALVMHAFRMGGRLEQLATKEELDDYLPRREFMAFKNDTKDDFARIEAQIADTRREIIQVIRESRK